MNSLNKVERGYSLRVNVKKTNVMWIWHQRKYKIKTVVVGKQEKGSYRRRGISAKYIKKE